MKKILLLTLLIVSITSLYGQRLKIAEELSVDMKKNVVDLSFGGSGQFLSLNYTRVLKIEKKIFYLWFNWSRNHIVYRLSRIL